MMKKILYESVPSKTIVNRCCVSSCVRIYTDISKYRVDYLTFPEDPQICDVWRRFCGKSRDWKPKEDSFICESHFNKNDSGSYYMIPTKKLGKEISSRVPEEYKMLLYDSSRIYPPSASRSPDDVDNDSNITYEEDHIEYDVIEETQKEEEGVEYVVDEEEEGIGDEQLREDFNENDYLVEYEEESPEEAPDEDETYLIPPKPPTEYQTISVTILSNISTDKSVQQLEVSKLLLEYVNTVIEHELPLNRLTLSNEAMAIADFLGYKNFVVSSEWMTKFTKANKIKFSSPVQDVFDEKAFYLLQLGGDDFYFNRDLAKKLQNSTNYTNIEKKYGRTKMCQMINTLNTYTNLQTELNDRLIKFMRRCPLLDGYVLHKKALIIARSFGFHSYVGSFAGLWALLSKTSIKFIRVVGTLPQNYSSYYENDEDDSLDENEIVEMNSGSDDCSNDGRVQIPDGSTVDIIEIQPDSQEYMIDELVPTENMTEEEIVFLDDQVLYYDLQEEQGRTLKRCTDEVGLYSTTLKRVRLDGNHFDEGDLDF